MKTILNVFFLVVFFVIPGFVRAQLTVQDPTVYGTKPGYIDRTTLVVEPHGAFVEQSLYVWYSDHDQYPGDNNLEIVHRFTLPQGSVVNDMWLWIGDTLVEAKMFSIWTARHIYDSIVVHRHDPAFLAKNGNTYELHIYPLVSGQFRKTRIDFIAPTQWLGKNGYAELPLSFWKDNNNQAKPVELLFREKEDVWGTPSIRELPQLTSDRVIDSVGYTYRQYDISDVSALTSLSFSFQTSFNNGLFATADYRQGDSSYFQIGIDPGSFNAVRSDTGAMSVVVGLDLSGNSNNSMSSLVPNISAVLHRALRPIDQFRLIVSGAGSIIQYSPWRYADSTTIDTVLQDFSSSWLAEKISQTRKPVIVFCDDHAQTIWRFPSLDSVAIIESFPDIVSASGSFANADIIASYDHGLESASLTDANLSMLLPKIDSLFYRGGRFLGYFDHNRPGGEKIETHYINGLTEGYEDNSVTLFAQPSGNIGTSFPSSVVENSVNFLTFNDPDTKTEMANSAGDGAVISKKVSNGLLVVSGIWAFVDDGALKQMLAVPLLGISELSQGPQMLKPLLNEIQSSLAQESVQEVLLFSNADSLISKADVSSWIDTYLSSISGTKPVFNTVNLIDGTIFTPASITENGVDYYGSGYLLNALSQATRGLHFETHLKTWDVISEELAYSTVARLDSLNVNVVADSGSGSLFEMREVAPEPNDPVRPHFFIGASNAKTKLDFNVVAKFEDFSQQMSKQTTSFISIDTSGRFPIIGEMLGWEKLQDYFQTSSSDTLSIVNLALEYNLLCDYTALIALEPKTDTPAQNPTNGQGGGSSAVKSHKETQTAIVFSAYPNPFNPQTTFYLSLRGASAVKIIIYNLLGQQIRTLSLDGFPGDNTIVWDGKDSSGRMVPSGVYFAQVMVTETTDNITFRKILKLVMLK